MENQIPISTHILKTDYSKKGKLKTIITGWCIFLLIFGATRVPSVQIILLNIQSNLGRSVSWVYSSIDFIINGLAFVFIPMAIGTVLTIREKHLFQSINVYETGIGFINNNVETFQPYDKIQLSWWKMKQSFHIGCKELGIKENNYRFDEFTEPNLLYQNLETYSNIM